MDSTKCLIYRRFLLFMLVSPGIILQLPRTISAEFKNDLGKEATDSLAEMMKSPRAKLYTGTNFTGNYEQYDLKIAGNKMGCHRLTIYSGQIKSIDTEGTCVRLFSNCICESWSQAFYPGIDGNSIDSKLGGVKCIGPCSSNELDGAKIRISASKLTVEKSEKGVPDLIGDWWTRSGFKSVNDSHSIVQYYLGVGNRLEGVNGYIVSQKLRSPGDSERIRKAGQNYTAGRFQLDEEKEEVGFGIPLELGGPSDKVYNVFPQDKAGAVKYRQAFVPVIKKYLQDKPKAAVLLAVHFFYANLAATKPMGMWYRMHRIATENVTYGYIFNSDLGTIGYRDAPEKSQTEGDNSLTSCRYMTSCNTCVNKAGCHWESKGSEMSCLNVRDLRDHPRFVIAREEGCKAQGNNSLTWGRGLILSLIIVALLVVVAVFFGKKEVRERRTDAAPFIRMGEIMN